MHKASGMSNPMFLLMGICFLSSAVVSADVNYAIEEQSPPGSLIGNIPDSIDLASIESQANLPYMRYSFLSIDASLRSLFSLDDKTGDLRLSSTAALDREVICQFDTTCNLKLQLAIQSTHTQFFRKVLVNIDVIDINDHAPQFKENFTTLTISESVQIPSSFPLPSALDKDTGVNNSLQAYEIYPSDGPFELSYSKSNPNLMLRVIEELDHETRDKYSIRIIARDGGDPPREGVLNADIYVEDVNDNAPRFTQKNYIKDVDETVNQGSLLLTLTATDGDSGKNGDIIYSLSPRQPASIWNMFSLDEISGELRLIGDFQKAEAEVYKIDVEASDMAEQPFTTKTTVTIYVNDTINSRPKLIISYLSANNFSSISEYANLGVAVAHILVKDTDKGPNGIVQCDLITGGFFELQSYDVKEYKVIVARPLDRESIQIHNLTVQCVDAGTPPLSTSKTFQVRVTDENDHSPVFEEELIFATIKENNEIGAEVVTVTAKDADDPDTVNGDISYSLQDVSNGEFLIDPDTGVIKAMTSFDYEDKRQINFTVVAEDNGTPRRSAKVAIGVSILDENDRAPDFPQDRFSIAVSEYASLGDLIGEIPAFDSEQGKNGMFSITLISGSGRTKRNYYNSAYAGQPQDDSTTNNYETVEDGNLPFEVLPNGSVVLIGEIDYETRYSYEFGVRVTDKGVPPLSDTATVVIDVTDENDNAPNILHPNSSEIIFTAMTGSDAPKTLTAFEVFDRDSGSNGLLVYTITARNDSGRFEIDQGKGEVKRTRDLSGKDAGTYKLSVMVRDSGIPPLSDLRTLLIHVTGGNATAGGSGTTSDQYIIIALTLVCITVLLSVTIVLVIVIMRRLDRRRKSNGHGGTGGPMHIQNTRVVSSFADPIKMDHFRNENNEHGSGDYRDDDIGSLDKKEMNDSHFGFSSSSGSINKGNSGDGGYQANQVNNLNLPTSASREGDIDLEALQLHQVLLQTYQDSQAVAVVPEDGASDSSGETITSDSGRGGSDEEISNTNMAAGNSMEDSRAGHNGSFQSNISTFGQIGSLKSSVKDPVRSSSRKHVTFQDMERFRNSIRSQAELQGRSGQQGNDMDATNSGIPLAQLSGPLQKQPMTSFGVHVSPRGQQNPLSEMNIPVPRDNSNTRVDNPKHNNLKGYPSKNSPRGASTASNYVDARGRDSPRLQTFPTSNPPQQPFQNLSSPRLPFYDGEDPIPSPMPRESPREWRNSPRLSNQELNNSNVSSSSQPYVHMSSPRDRLKQQQHFRSQSPLVFPNSSLPRSESTSSSSRNSPRIHETGQSNSLNKENGRGFPHMNSPRDQNKSLNPQFNTSLPSPRTTSPAPVVPPREAIGAHISNSAQSLLINNDMNSYHKNQNQQKMPIFSSRDWTNESIATTDDGDDQRSTTTSGSYTIDNEDEYLALEFKPKDIVV